MMSCVQYDELCDRPDEVPDTSMMIVCAVDGITVDDSVQMMSKTL